MSLFDDEPAAPASNAPAPLAERMRPRTLDEFVGQEHSLGARPAAARAPSSATPAVDHPLGPAGHRQDDAGAHHRRARPRAHFISFSAVLAGHQGNPRRDGRSRAKRGARPGRRTIVFIDEIHRFNKAQQDAFLPRVEAGDIILIGATTENPSFEVNSALLSRSKVYVLQGARRPQRDQRDPASRAGRSRARPRCARHRRRRRGAARRSRATPTATRASR